MPCPRLFHLFLVILLLGLFFGGAGFTASANDSPTAVTAGPASPTENPEARPRGLRNRRGLLDNPELAVVGWDDGGCPTLSYAGPQFVRAREAQVHMAAATDARVRCVRADAERLRAKGDYGATLLLASAGADAVRTAVERGDPTYVDGDRKVAATGNAAFVAAAASESGGYGPALGNYGYVQAAWNLTRPPVPVVVAPPPETPPAGSGGAAAVPPPATSSAGPSQATVKEAENQVLGVTE